MGFLCMQWYQFMKKEDNLMDLKMNLKILLMNF